MRRLLDRVHINTSLHIDHLEGSAHRMRNLRSSSFVETLNFMFAVAGGLGTILYVVHGITDNKGTDPKSIKNLEVISTLEYVAAILLLLAFTLFSIGKLCLFGYERVVGVDPAEEADRIRKAIEKEEMNTVVKDNLARLRIDRMLQGRRASFRLARTDISGERRNLDLAISELEDLLDEQVISPAPLRGIARLPQKVRRYVRYCLFGGALCCLLATITTCVVFFLSFLFKVDHTSLAVRLVFACAICLVACVVVVGNALVMATALSKD